MTVGDGPQEQVPSKAGEQIGRDGKLFLPTPHPLVQDPEPGSFGARLNKRWSVFNYFLRGLYATGVEWLVSFMDMALEYPKVAVVMFMLLGVVAEETMLAHPMLAGTFEWIMFTLDPEAAKMIFPEDASPADAEEAFDKLAADIVLNASEDYYNSGEYKEIELELRARMHAEIVARIEAMTGVATLDPEAASEP